VDILVIVMPEDTCPVQWTGRQAVVTLPQHIDGSNAGQIRERLLWIINRGAAVLIADLAGTLSCDYGGAEALARAHHRAAANGTELRLVVTADAVRRVLRISGLDRPVAVYPDLDGAIAASAGRREARGEHRTGTADQPARAGELLDSVVRDVLAAGLLLQAAADLPRDAAAQHITQALGRLDDVVRDVRDHVLAGPGQGSGPGCARSPRPDVLARSALARNRAAPLRQQVAHTARALHLAAADTAALLEQRAGLAGQPSRIDYPTEIKRWRVFADQARELAECWEQQL
jgi:anti-sigma B factor antagonist